MTEPRRIPLTPAQRAQFDRLAQQKQTAEDRINVFCDGVILGHLEPSDLEGHSVQYEDGVFVLRPVTPTVVK